MTMASFLSTRLNERSNPTGLLFSFVGGATLSSNRALRALQAQQNPVRNIRTASGAKFRVYFSRPRWSGEISDKNFIFLFLGAHRIRFAFATRRSASSLARRRVCEYSRKARNSEIRLQCILIKKMPIGIFEQGSRSEPLPCLFVCRY